MGYIWKPLKWGFDEINKLSYVCSMDFTYSCFWSLKYLALANVEFVKYEIYTIDACVCVRNMCDSPTECRNVSYNCVKCTTSNHSRTIENLLHSCSRMYCS